MKFIKILSYSLFSLLFILYSYIGTSSIVLANPPSFKKDYAEHLLWGKGNTETVWDLSKIGLNKDVSIKENIKNIFYPDISGQWWKLRDILKVLWLIVYIIMIVVQGIQYVMSADTEDKVKNFHTNFVYIFLGALLFFWSTWILWIGLNIWGDGWSAELMNKLDQSIMFQVFSWLRSLAFFAAIILLIFTGWKIMVAMDQEDKYKAATKWILNIIIPLTIIKVIDYIYYIAQTPNFKSRASELIVEVSKALGYILGWLFTIMVIYYWFRLMFWGDDEQLKKVKSVIMAIFLWSLVIFIFFLIIYQIAQEFAL